MSLRSWKHVGTCGRGKADTFAMVYYDFPSVDLYMLTVPSKHREVGDGGVQGTFCLYVYDILLCCR